MLEVHKCDNSSGLLIRFYLCCYNVQVDDKVQNAVMQKEKFSGRKVLRNVGSSRSRSSRSSQARGRSRVHANE